MWFDVCEGVRLVSEFGVCDNDLVCFQYKLRDGEVEWILSRSVLKECAASRLEVVGDGWASRWDLEMRRLESTFRV